MSIALVFAISLFGISFASWQIISTQETTNTVVTGCFDVLFTPGTNINRLDIDYPISDVTGQATTPYTFTVKNNCTGPTALNVSYVLRLDILSTSTMPENKTKGYLTKGAGTVVKGPALLSNTGSFPTITIADAGYKSTAYTLDTGTLAANASVTYNLRLWIDESAIIAETSGTTFSARVTVVSTATT